MWPLCCRVHSVAFGFVDKNLARAKVNAVFAFQNAIYIYLIYIFFFALSLSPFSLAIVVPPHLLWNSEISLLGLAHKPHNNCRIVRNKAAEKAKHVHHQQQNQTCPPQNSNGGPAGNSVVNVNNVNSGSSANNNSGITGNVSVIIHSGNIQQQQQQAQQHSTQTQLTTGSGSGEQRSTGYSINGILGIQHTTDPNGNSIKRKRIDGLYFHFSLIIFVLFSTIILCALLFRSLSLLAGICEQIRNSVVLCAFLATRRVTNISRKHRISV